MPIVDIKGVGKAQFPDDMPIADIRNFLRNKYSQQVLKGESDLLEPAPQTIEPYQPTLSQKMGQGVADALYNSGVISDRYGAQRIGSNVTAIGEMLPGIGDATAGDELGRAMQKGDYGDAALAGVGALPVVGDMAIFAGALAKNANLGALKEAKALELQGKDRDEIWSETGWFNDRGDWKFEIDDSKSVFDIKDEALFNKELDLKFALAKNKEGAEKYAKSEELEAKLIEKYGEDYASNWDAIPEAEAEEYFDSLNKIPETIEDILWDIDEIKGGNLSYRQLKPNQESQLSNSLLHNDVYENYPDSRNVNLQYNTSSINTPKEANYAPSKDRIAIGDPTYKDIKSPVLHELQHAIQERENFAKGGTPGKGAIEAAKEQINKNIAPIKESIDKIEGSDKYRNRIDELIGQGYRKRGARIVADKEFGLDKLNKEWIKTSPIEKAVYDKQSQNYNANAAYKRLAGEAEARLVQKRMNMTPEERRAKPPWQDLDVPEDELIYRKDSGGANQSLPMDKDTTK